MYQNSLTCVHSFLFQGRISIRYIKNITYNIHKIFYIIFYNHIYCYVEISRRNVQLLQITAISSEKVLSCFTSESTIFLNSELIFSMSIFEALNIFFVTGSLNKSHSGNTVSESSDNGMIAGITIVVALVVSAAVGTVINTSLEVLLILFT